MLGLPSFRAEVSTAPFDWLPNHYQAALDFLKLEGFGPLTLDYARKHKPPLFKVMPDEVECAWR